MSYFDDNEARITGLDFGSRLYKTWEKFTPIKIQEKTKLMQFDIKAVDVEWTGTGAKKYGKATVTYFAGGQPRQHKVMSFVNPEVFKKVQELSGQTVEVEVVKNDKGFNEWKSITVSGGAPAPVSSGTSSAPTTRVSGSNYETKEERAARQVLIVKQSSLSAAAATLAPGAKAALDPELVIATAQRYADWVFETEPDASGFDTMSQDIPF